MSSLDPSDARPTHDHYAPPNWYFDDPRVDVAGLLPVGISGVLDVGCGSGAFLNHLRTVRPDLVLAGIENDERSASIAADTGLDVRHACFPDGLSNLGSGIDCVVFNDVLEHLVNPWHALAAATDIVGPDGQVVVSLPNLRNLDTLRDLILRGDFRYRSHGVLDVTHLRFFTLRSARRLVEEAGLEVVSQHSIGRLRSRRLLAFGKAVGLVIPWVRREGVFRQFVLIARPARSRPSNEPQRRPSKNQP